MSLILRKLYLILVNLFSNSHLVLVSSTVFLCLVTGLVKGLTRWGEPTSRPSEFVWSGQCKTPAFHAVENFPSFPVLIPHVLATPSDRFLPQGSVISSSAGLLSQTRPSSPGPGMCYRLTLFIATSQPLFDATLLDGQCQFIKLLPVLIQLNFCLTVTLYQQLSVLIQFSQYQLNFCLTVTLLDSQC